MRSLLVILVVLLTLLLGCNSNFSEKDYEPGSNGEAPKALPIVYSKRFLTSEENYVSALGTIHAFLIENSFYPVVYTQCFMKVLDIRVRASIERHKETFPCVALQAQKGAPTKIYLNVKIDEVNFNRLNGDNRLAYTVSMSGQNDLVAIFKADIESRLSAYYGQRLTEE